MLAGEGATAEELSRIVLCDQPTVQAASDLTVLQRLRQGPPSLLSQTVLHQAQPVFRLHPIAEYPLFAPRLPVQPAGRYRLSRFAHLRLRNDDYGAGWSPLVLESPLSGFRGISHDGGLPLITSLATPITRETLTNRCGELGDETVSAILQLLLASGLVTAEDAQPRSGTRMRLDVTFPEDTDPDLRIWEFHDLLFHARSRTGLHDDQAGPTFRLAMDIEPGPATRPLPIGKTVLLPQPDAKEVLANDPPLTAVLETRHSRRNYSETPLNLQQLGEFLFRTARLRATAGPGQGLRCEIADHPYPTGGALGGLDLFLTVNRVHGLTRAVYYYDPAGHALVEVNSSPDDTENHLTQAAASSPGMKPDVLITVVSRFERTAWKYSAFPYAITLANTGVLYQTFYLVATAMRLAACALAGGNTSTSVRALCLNWPHEVPVGDFILGTPEPRRNPDHGPEWRTVRGSHWLPETRTGDIP
ncbi:SagB family peptide dehydrogenase [Streptomyces virginiae]|uniref:SagB family peptide dehydrogenase n=1 Tax=Streptomyces virginiae TaxID=1961 RepID=UPI000B003647